MRKRRELKGDPSNPQTRRRASGDDPRRREPKEATGRAEPGRPPTWTGVKIPCPVCCHGVWGHQINELAGKPRDRGAPGIVWNAEVVRDRPAMRANRWPKNPHTGAHGAYWEWEVASPVAVANAEKWIEHRMRRWLERKGLSQQAQTSELADAIDRADEWEREFRGAVVEIVQLKDQLEMLQAEYARVRAIAESPRSRPAAANPPQRWEDLPTYAAGVDYSHMPALRDVERQRRKYEETRERERLKYEETVDRAESARTERLSWPQESYVVALRRYEAETSTDCSKPCCAQRELILADLTALA